MRGKGGEWRRGEVLREFGAPVKYCCEAGEKFSEKETHLPRMKEGVNLTQVAGMANTLVMEK